MITPPLLIAGALKLGGADTAYLVSMSLFVSGAATILQVSRFGPVGSGLLSIQGTSFTFIAPIISVAGSAMAGGATAGQALGGIFGLCMTGALVVVLVSRFIQRARADGSFGSLQNLGLAALVLLVILVFNTSRSPRLRMLPFCRFYSCISSRSWSPSAI